VIKDTEFYTLSAKALYRARRDTRHALRNMIKYRNTSDTRLRKLTAKMYREAATREDTLWEKIIFNAKNKFDN